VTSHISWDHRLMPTWWACWLRWVSVNFVQVNSVLPISASWVVVGYPTQPETVFSLLQVRNCIFSLFLAALWFNLKLFLFSAHGIQSCLVIGGVYFLSLMILAGLSIAEEPPTVPLLPPFHPLSWSLYPSKSSVCLSLG
jgi:hypothetical protein